jgi:hypothetical protein
LRAECRNADGGHEQHRGDYSEGTLGNHMNSLSCYRSCRTKYKPAI